MASIIKRKSIKKSRTPSPGRVKRIAALADSPPKPILAFGVGQDIGLFQHDAGHDKLFILGKAQGHRVRRAGKRRHPLGKLGPHVDRNLIDEAAELRKTIDALMDRKGS